MADLEQHSNFETCPGTHNMWQPLSLSNGKLLPAKKHRRESKKYSSEGRTCWFLKY